MNTFEFEEAKKIESIINLFKEYFPFQINNKNLETLIFQGGMGVDVSTIDLATAVSETGSGGVIATTLSKKKDELIKKFNDVKKKGIIGFNNLVSALDYETNYNLGLRLGSDFIFSGAGISREVINRIKGQSNYLKQNHYFTIPIISTIDQLKSYFKLNKNNQHREAGIICFENSDAGGHNNPDSLGFEESLEQFKETYIDKKGDKIICAGGIRTPKQGIMALNAGYDAIQLGTLFLLADESNTTEKHKQLILNAKKGDVGNIPSPAGLPAKGFVNEGVIKYSINGIDSPKLDYCKDNNELGCFANCNNIKQSGRSIGIENPGDYCIKTALYQLNNNRTIYENGPVYFSGSRPEELFIINYMKEKNLTSLPTKMIIGKFLVGMFDSIMNSEGLKDEHRYFLEKQYKTFTNQFKAKILTKEKYNN